MQQCVCGNMHIIVLIINLSGMKKYIMRLQMILICFISFLSMTDLYQNEIDIDYLRSKTKTIIKYTQLKKRERVILWD